MKKLLLQRQDVPIFKILDKDLHCWLGRACAHIIKVLEMPVLPVQPIKIHLENYFYSCRLSAQDAVCLSKWQDVLIFIVFDKISGFERENRTFQGK